MDSLEREAALVERAQAGDEQALGELLGHYLPSLEAYVRLRVGPGVGAREGASDIVQSTCRELLQDAPAFRYGGDDSFRRWLFATAARKVADKYAHHNALCRDRAREAASGAVSLVLERLVGGLPSPSQQAQGRELEDRFARAFARLSEEEREVVLLSRLAGLSRLEVAAEMGKSEGAVRNQLHRALAKLAGLLTDTEV